MGPPERRDPGRGLARLRGDAGSLLAQAHDGRDAVTTGAVIEPPSWRCRPRPYVGLVPFSESDAAFFFGRDEWSGRSSSTTCRPTRSPLLYGEQRVGQDARCCEPASCTGCAGGRPRSREEAATRQSRRRRRSSWPDDPLAELVGAAARWRSRQALDEEPGRQHRPSDLGRRARGLQPIGSTAGLLVILDQLEELLPLPRGTSRAGASPRSSRRIVNSARPALASFLSSIREDSLARLDRFKPRLPNLFDNSLRIEHLDARRGPRGDRAPLEEYYRADRARRPRSPSSRGSSTRCSTSSSRGSSRSTPAEAGLAGPTAAAARSRPAIEPPYLQLVLHRLWDEERAAASRTCAWRRSSASAVLSGSCAPTSTPSMGALPPADQDVAAARPSTTSSRRSGTKIAHRGRRPGGSRRPAEPSRLAPLLARLAGGDVRLLRPGGDVACYEIFHDVLAPP